MTIDAVVVMLTSSRYKSYRLDYQLQHDRLDDPTMLYDCAMAEHPDHCILAGKA